MLFESARCLKNLLGNLKVFLCLNFCKIIDEAIVAILMVAQAFSKIFEVLFMFNFYKKLDKDVGRICTVPRNCFENLKVLLTGKSQLQ